MTEAEQAHAWVASVRLASAAPDLLAALKGLMTIGQFALMDPPPPFEEITARYDAARAAIAKAEGR